MTVLSGADHPAFQTQIYCDVSHCTPSFLYMVTSFLFLRYVAFQAGQDNEI